MLIGEACLEAGLTKKAVEYYTEQGLVFPSVLDNGYKDYSLEDVARLKRAGLLRRLGLNVKEIKLATGEAGGGALQRISAQKALLLSKEQKKCDLLMKLTQTKQFEDILPDMKSLEEQTTIAQRLLDALPGFLGCYISLHFAHFLDGRILTEDQESAYQEIIAFLDDMPPFMFSQDVQELLEQSVNSLSGQEISGLAENTVQAVENFEAYFSEHRDAMETYMAFKQSDAYHQSGVPQLESAWKGFLSASGYYTVFLPAMKRLSPAYAEYAEKLEIANEKALALYPELAGSNRLAE